MWNRAEIKARGKAFFKANYWACVLAAVILSVAIGGGFSTSANKNDNDGPKSSEAPAVLAVAGGIGGLLGILVFNPLQAGCQKFFLENTEPGQKPTVGEVLYFFKEGRWGNAVAVMFVYKLFLCLWTLLFIIPGIVKGYSYRMVPYLLCQNPGIGPKEAIGRSRAMMDGKKSSAFVFDLSFIGWYLLGAITLGIGLVFYVSPWVQNANAVLARVIMGEE